MNEETRIDLTTLRPLDAGVLLLRLPDHSSQSSLIIPDIAQKPSHRGKVVRTGKGRRAKDGSYLPLAVKLDDVVYYQSSDIDDGTHVLIQEADILGIESFTLTYDDITKETLKVMQPYIDKELNRNA